MRCGPADSLPRVGIVLQFGSTVAIVVEVPVRVRLNSSRFSGLRPGWKFANVTVSNVSEGTTFPVPLTIIMWPGER